MEQNNKPNSDNLKNALCYVPFAAIVLFFTEEKKSNSLKKHIKY
jgi:DNA polymerase III delta subunit